ncbi:unnamed protein product, partial [Timema podura]|nr:unnamed protein product [Timema podura]
VQSIPKYTSQVVGRFIKPLSQSYHDLASAYFTNNSDDLRALINKYQEPFTRDSNMGLCKQVLASLYKKNIQRLTKTFLTLSLSDVASRVQLSGPLEAEKYILNMIEDGEIFATINQKDGMVIFHDDPEKYNSPDMLRSLEEEMAVCTDLDRKIQSMEEDIMVNPQFVKKSCGAQDDELPLASTQSSKVTAYAIYYRQYSDFVNESDSDITSDDDNVPDLRNPAVHNMSNSDENDMDDEDYRKIMSPEQSLPPPFPIQELSGPKHMPPPDSLPIAFPSW